MNLESTYIQTIYITFTHNKELMGYVLGFMIMTLVSLIKPTRSHLLVTFGFLILVFGFEYDKHIINGLREQTINALQVGQGISATRINFVNIFLTHLLPIIFWLTGWGVLLIGLIFGGVKKKIDTR
ncbi:MAG: hypothetical protein O2871_01460 [bacterium]|nr:hypothetical protein [bacterium]